MKINKNKITSKSSILTFIIAITMSFNLILVPTAYAATKSPCDIDSHYVYNETQLLYSIQVSIPHTHKRNYNTPVDGKKHINVKISTLAGFVEVANIHVWKVGKCYYWWNSKSGGKTVYSTCSNSLPDAIRNILLKEMSISSDMKIGKGAISLLGGIIANGIRALRIAL